MQMSSVIDFFEEHQGATINYLKDRPEAEQVTCTMIFRAKTNEKFLDLMSLMNQQVPHVEGVNIQELIEAHLIHVVTSVCYGAEIYCVLAHGFDDVETDQETRQKIEQKLSNLATKWLEALNELQDLEEFKKRFDKEERHLISRVKCRLYADEPVHHCDFFASYKLSLELMNNIFKIPEENADGNSRIAPMAIKLCPLKVLANPIWGVDNTVTYYDVDRELTESCCAIFAGLNRVIVRTKNILNSNELSKLSAISDAMEEFLNLIFHYIESLQVELREHVELCRLGCANQLNNDVETIADAAENHRLFSPRQLDQWLNFKLTELEMLDSMEKRTGTGVQLICGQIKLGQQPELPTPNKKFSVLLYVPPLDDLTHFALKSMDKCARDPSRYFALKKEKLTDCKQPWHTIHRKKKIVLDKIGELTRHVERNKNILNDVNFIVCQTKSRKLLQCSYHVFDNVSQSSHQLNRLPDPPTGLRIYRQVNRNSKKAKMCSFSIRVEWDYEELGVPCTFVLQSRLKGSSEFRIQQKTVAPGQTQLKICFETETVREIRVAAETFVGLGEFSQIVDTETAILEEEDNQLLLSPPRKQPNVGLQPQTDVKVKSVTRNSAELEWPFLPGFGNKFRVDYWKLEEDYVNRMCKFQDESPCLLENLQEDTTYLATVSSGDGSNWSSPSNAIVFSTTGGCRFAESLAMRSEKIRNEDGKDVYAVPLEKRNVFLTNSDKFVFGEADQRHNHRTVLLIGACNSGKTSLINSMINWIFGVDVDDPFRFQLIDPHEEDDQKVTVYEINFAKGFRVDYSLTIINTPNYVEEDAEKNKKITEIIGKFFDDDVAGIQQVDAVGFVLDSSECELEPVNLHIYCSLISIFGNGIEENVKFLCNYDSGEDPPLLSAISNHGRSLRHKLENLKTFLSSIALTSTKSTVSVSKQILDETKRLEATALRLRYRMKMEMAKFEEIRKKNKIFKRNSSHEHLKFEVNATAAKKRILPLGNYVINCNNCEFTCRPVSDTFNVPLADESRVCRVCPGKCSWKHHVDQSFKWEYVQEKQVTTPGAIKKLYEEKLEKTLTRREVIKAMNSEVEVRKKDLVTLINSVLQCGIQLNQVARLLNENWKTRCVKVRVKVSKKATDVLQKLLNIEAQNPSQNYMCRIEALKRLKRAARFNAIGHLLSNDWNFWSILNGLDLQFFTPVTEEEEEEEEGEDEPNLEEESDQEDEDFESSDEESEES